MDFDKLKEVLRRQDPAFWQELAARTVLSAEFDELIGLSAMRRRALARGFLPPGPRPAPLRLAMLGGHSLYPLRELVEHMLEAHQIPCQLFAGEFDNYVSEIMEPGSRLYEFQPQCVFLLPSPSRCKYSGGLGDPKAQAQAEAEAFARQLLQLAQVVHERAKAEVILANLMLPARHDPGPGRSRWMGSDWNFRKWANLELGLNSGPFIHLCDLEFLAYRRGALSADDERGWFESKQPGSPALLVDMAREIAHLIAGLRRPPRKVLVMDLDNTLWGGVVAEDGLEGIELGDTSPRGEAFKAFQKHVLSLQQRGALLAVCSKNDHAQAMEPFERHPEMVLRPQHFVSFKANWEPKSENLRRLAAELNLGLDSFVFMDDNPAEIEIVRQFAPEVATLLLGPDPAGYVGQLKDSRLFEPKSLTAEDALRTAQYQSEAQHHALLASVTDMAAYLESLQMEARISQFSTLDAPRIAQLISKSNQFNLTTRRRTEAEVVRLMDEPDYACFSIRLKDRFGDHGLIAVIIGRVEAETFEIDTWIMSCRVLKRQVEEAVLNELARLARSRGCARLQGVYLPTARNEMVRDLYERLGFTLTVENEECRQFELALEKSQPLPTHIKIVHLPCESS
jgi:FkbH-like protein